MAREHGPCSDGHSPCIPMIGLSNETCEIRWCLACGQIEFVNKINDTITVLKQGVSLDTEDALVEER